MTIPKILAPLLATLPAFFPLALLNAQSATPDAAPYIVFLHELASSASARQPPAGAPASSEDRAARLHVAPAELQALDDAARAFTIQEDQLRQEALQYGSRCKLAHEKPDQVVVHSFAVRRASLAAASMAAIQARVSPASFARLSQFIDSQVKGAASAWR